MAEEVFIPKFGQTVEEVTLIHWLVDDGSEVEQGQGILEVETDKAIFTVEANEFGLIHRMPFKEGDVIPVLTVVALIAQKGEQLLADINPVDKPEIKSLPLDNKKIPVINAAISPRPLPQRIFISPRAKRLAENYKIDLKLINPTGGNTTRIIERDIQSYLEQITKATPVAQRIAEKKGIDLSSLEGTGYRGQITKADVVHAMEDKNSYEETKISSALEGVTTKIPFKGIRALIGDRMASSVHTVARVTLIMEVDATELCAMREQLKTNFSEKWGFTPGYNDIIAKIVSTGLVQFPYMNGRLVDSQIELLPFVNMGMAVDTDRGLLVPVIRNSSKLSLRNFGLEFRRLVEQTRNGRIAPDDLSGGTFTITNLGMYDVDAFTPIINLPETAILGVGRISPKVVPYKGQIMIREQCVLSLAFDHRLVDGAPAAKFLQYVKNLIECPTLWLGDIQE